MDSVFYSSGDQEFKYIFGSLITENTKNCDSYKFSYPKKISAQIIGDQNYVPQMNFPTVVNGLTTSSDYLSIFTTNY